MSTLCAGSFSTYDFTFYKSIQDSIAIANGERFGFDYSGYGYLGKEMTSGIYLRIGIQTPYKTILDMLRHSLDKDPAELEDVDLSIDSMLPDLESTPELDIEGEQKVFLKPSMAKDYILSFTIGPAFRKFISDEVIWYFGMGIRSAIENTTTPSESGKVLYNNFSIASAADLDSGFRIDLANRSTLRIGVSLNTGLLSYSSTSEYDQNGERIDFSNEFFADIFTPQGETTSTTCLGYISIATTFRNRAIKRYRYTITSSIPGEGELLLIE